MGGTPYAILLIFVFAFTFIFWFLIFITRFYFQNSTISSKKKNTFYECGFKAYNTFSPKVSTQVFTVAILLLIYDYEFLMLLPFLTNLWFMSIYMYIFIATLIIVLGLFLYLDSIYLFFFWVN